MQNITRREAITAASAIAAVGAANIAMADHSSVAEQTRVLEAEEKLLLYWWDWTYYGAHMHVDLYYYVGTTKFCYEGTLDYAGVTKIAEGELCFEQNANGSFTVSGDCLIRLFGEKVASLDGRVTSRVDWDEGRWYLESYRFELCGSNSFELRCDTWEEGTRRDRIPKEQTGVFVTKDGLANSEEQRRLALAGILAPRLGQVRQATPPARPAGY